ncbi:16884_t:CDS:1, partial [Acaulospora colombiana]
MSLSFCFESSNDSFIRTSPYYHSPRYSQEDSDNDWVDLSHKGKGPESWSDRMWDNSVICQFLREETNIQDLWVPASCPASPTRLPTKYELHAKRLPFLARFEMIRLSKPFGPIEASETVWEELVDRVDFHVFSKICREQLERCKKNNVQTELRKLVPYSSSLWKASEQPLTSKKGSSLHLIFSANVIMKDRKLQMELNPPKTGLSKR